MEFVNEEEAIFDETDFLDSNLIADQFLIEVKPLASDLNRSLEQNEESTCASGIQTVASGNTLQFVVQDDDILEDENPNPVEFIDKERELTDKYISGKLTFRDFVREMDNSGEEEEEEEVVQRLRDSEESEENDDDDWIPEAKKSKANKKSPKNFEKNQSFSSLPGGLSSIRDEESEEDHRVEFEKELNQASHQQLTKKKKRVGVRMRRKRLEPALQGLMGEANLMFASGNKETAIRMCMEVIKQDPSAPEPFQTLSALYDDTGEPEKSLQFSLIAAHLAPQDSEEWARLADLSLELGDRSQAAVCFRKAIDAEPDNLYYHLARCELLEQLEDTKSALRGYKRFLQVLKPNQGAEFFQGSKEVARILHHRGDIEDAKNIIETAFKKYPDAVTPEEAYEEALEVLCKYCTVKFSSSIAQETLESMASEEQLKHFNKAILLGDTPLDIRAKLIVVLINLSANHLVVDQLHKPVINSDPEEFGDLILDVAEAYMKLKLFNDALRYLKRLVDSDKYSKAVVWLQYGECLFKLNKLEEAEKAYQTVVELAPQHYDARKALSMILHKLGKPNEALKTLTQDEEEELLDSSLLYERCHLLLSEGRYEQFIVKAQLLFNRHFVHIRNKDELHAIASAKKLASKNKALSEVRAYHREPLETQKGPAFYEDEKGPRVPIKDEFELFHKLCSLLYDMKRYNELQRITFSAIGSPFFNKLPDFAKEGDFFCLLSAYKNGDCYHAYNIVRELVLKHTQNSKIWNLFNLVIMRADDVRHNRFLMRLMARNPDSIALSILNGHNCLVAGTYKYSLGEYMAAFKQDKTNPMIALMIGLTFIHMACQKFSAKKHSLVVQGCSFLNMYINLRGSCQESYYNVGRAVHQLGLLPTALFYYKKVLNTKPSISYQEEIFDLSKEAAYNTSLIYSASGSLDMARMYIQKYITI